MSNLENMDLDDLISQIHTRQDGLNPPAKADDLSKVSALLGQVPPDLEKLYRDHDGGHRIPGAGGNQLLARLMPINEVIETHNKLREYFDSVPSAGKSVLLWTDDNSNYCGLYLDRPLTGCVYLLDHEVQMLTPAYRSIPSFISYLLGAVEDENTCDVPTLPREIPVTDDDPTHVAADRHLCELFRRMYMAEKNEDRRRFFAYCCICLTPVADTEHVLSFLKDPDFWTPEAAIRLLEVRHWQGSIEPIEELARDGTINGDGAAMQLLVRMNNGESRKAIKRLKEVLRGQKRETLKMSLSYRKMLQPARW